MTGKQKCKILKQIRQQIADANDIRFVVEECTHKGKCRGTCPRCEWEVRMLEKALEKRRRSGKSVALAGISAGLLLTSCKPLETLFPEIEPLEGDVLVETSSGAIAETNPDPVVEGKLVAPPLEDETEVETELGEVEPVDAVFTEEGMIEAPDTELTETGAICAESEELVFEGEPLTPEMLEEEPLAGVPPLPEETVELMGDIAWLPEFDEETEDDEEDYHSAETDAELPEIAGGIPPYDENFLEELPPEGDSSEDAMESAAYTPAEVNQ